ncbi:MAG: acetyl-CoA carboxylase biotin carboxyl carrier protein subunit [Deltaproteobacteria bacterium]|nr:MAG: acetyl-CoA carboxylase biotin carboxyl carrier protein subunit [Deltaproteobacteria bacterium]
MRFTATHGEATHEIDVTFDGERYTVTLDGQKHEVDALLLEGNIWSLLIDGKSYEVDVEGEEEVTVRVRGRVHRFRILDERRMRMRMASGAFSAEGKQVVRAPMPGKVVKILVREGDSVEAEQGVVVVEAMKMENELRAPKAGTVKSIAVEEGALVEGQAALVVIE